MSAPVPARRPSSSQDHQRRKRKNRTPKNRTPEPKDIVSGTGQPLDHSTRQELEQRLGHDLSRVRVHTDRDAGELADMLGADAVTVGQDILFGPGKFRPGTSDGQRLLAHEVVHTVHNPTGQGALRAGRELGSVSLAQQGLEREAESSAQSASTSDTEVRTAQSTPGWLRYTTVDADRSRFEKLDPATLVDRLANGIVRSLRGDPEDRSKRTRKQLAHMSAAMREAVLDRLDTRLLSSEQERVLDLVEEIESDGEPERSALSAPDVEPDAESDLELQRQSQQQDSEQRQIRREKPTEAPGPEKEQAEQTGTDGSTPENLEPSEKAESNEPAEEQESGNQKQASSTEGPDQEESEQSGEAASEDKSADKPDSEEQSGGDDAESGPGGQFEDKNAVGDKSGKASGEKSDQDSDKTKDSQQSEEEREEQRGSQVGEEESENNNRNGATDQADGGKKQQDGREGSPKDAGQDGPQAGAVSELDGTRNQDAEGPQEKPASAPSGGDSEVEVGGGKESAWDIKLQPEDFLPKQDLDVSGVPTADKIEPGASSPSMPSFPEPPPTKADQVHAEREQEDAEDEANVQAEPGEDSEPPLESDPSVETESTPQAGGLSDLAAEKAADGGASTSEQPADPKSADDPEKGPAEAQRSAQDAPGKAEGTKDEAGGALKDSATKEEKRNPGRDKESEQNKEDTGSGEKDASGSEDKQATSGAEGKQDSEKTAGEGSANSEKSEKNSGDSDKQNTGGDSQGTGDKTDQSGGQEGSRSDIEKSDPAPSESGANTEGSEAGNSANNSTSESKRTEEPARTAEASPKAPAPKAESSKSEAPKAGVPKKAEEPKKPEGTAKKEETPKAKPSKSGPAPEAPRGGGKGTVGGSGAKPQPKGDKGKAGKAAPNLANVSPEAGLKTASSLKPHQALKAMNGVDSAVDRTVGDDHKKLSSDPPAMQRPAGAPQTLEGKPNADAPAEYSNSPAEKSDAPDKKDAEVKDQKKPEGKIKAEEVEEPSGWDTFLMGLGYVIGEIGSWFDSDIKPEDLAATFAGLPTEDDALKDAKTGTAPGVEMKGKSEDTTRAQDKNVDKKGDETQQTGRDDADRRMGEDQVYPNAPKEQLNGKVPAPQRDKGSGPADAGTGAVPEDAASEVAEHERGKQYRSSFGKGEQGLADAKKQKDKQTRESKQKHERSVDGEVGKNTKQQSSQRQQTVGDVGGERQRWRDEQDGERKKLGTKKSDKRRKAEDEVDKQEKDTDKKAEERKTEDSGKIRQKGKDAESDAKSKRHDTESQAGNWVEKAFEWIKQKFIELRDKIVEILKAARRAIVDFVENFKLDIEELINKIREAIVDLIEKVIEELVELAKAMVRAIVELANKIRQFITELIERAIALVQKLADQLKQIINDLLNAIAKLLSDILNVLKKALDDVIKAVKDAVKAVMDFASKLLSGLGQFMMVAVDFLRDPGGWLSGAANSAENGAKNHFFREVKSAVKTWFHQKIEEIISVPKAIIDKLIKGGLTLEWIVKQVWDAVVPQLPFILGEIIITKVVAKLIPGAGWVMAVIDAIKTAIGALGEILRAFGAVLTWLQSVRKAGAGVLFAKAVAAGVVALLELAYQFLLDGIGKYVSKVGDRLKNIAKNIGKKGRRKHGRGQGGDGEDSGGGSRPRGRADRPGRRSDQSGPGNTRPGEGRRVGRRPEDERGTDRRNNAGRRDEGRNEEDRQRQDDRVSPSSAARKAAHKPGGKPGSDRDGPKPERDENPTDRDRNQRGRSETDQDRRRREDNDRDRPDGDAKDRDKRPDRDDADRDKPANRDSEDRDQRSDSDGPNARDRKDRDESPAGKDKDGNPKGKEDDKPATSPTPNAKSKPKVDNRDRRDDTDGDTKRTDRDDGNGKQKPKDDDSDAKKSKDDAARTKRKGDDKDSSRRRDEADAKQQRGDKDSNAASTKRKDNDSGSSRRDNDRNRSNDRDDPNRTKERDKGELNKRKHTKEDTPRKGNRDTDNQKSGRKDRNDNDLGAKRTKHNDQVAKKGESEKKEKKQKRKDEEESNNTKEDRLRKIVARIRPKISRLLDAGIPEPALRVALAGMRSWHRLTSLTHSGSPNLEITAALNPRQVAGKGWELTGADIRDIAKRESKEILQRPEARNAELKMRRHRAAKGNSEPLEVSSNEDIPGAIKYYQERGERTEEARPDGDFEEYDAYLPKVGGGWPHSGEKEQHHVGPNQHEINEYNKSGTNAYVAQAGNYPAITKKLRDLNISDHTAARAMRQYSKDLTFPTTLSRDAQELLARLHWLIFVRESVRNTTNIAMAPMAISLMEGNQASSADLFSKYEDKNNHRIGKRGIYPMSMQGAPAAAIDLMNETYRMPGYMPYESREELRAREEHLADLWMQLQPRISKYFESEDEALIKARSEIRMFLNNYYNI